MTALPIETSNAYPRKELEKTMELWLEANKNAERERNWAKYLGPMYTDDAEYRWNIGPNEEFVARGRKEIEAIALDAQMEGFEGWTYPYHRVLIDEKQGEIVAFWDQVAPIHRADGSPYKVAGIGGSWFRYGGDHKWSWQVDFFDLGNVVDLLGQVAAAGGMNQTLKNKLQRFSRGGKLPGHETLRGDYGIAGKVKGKLALARIALLGR